MYLVPCVEHQHLRLDDMDWIGLPSLGMWDFRWKIWELVMIQQGKTFRGYMMATGRC